MITRRSIILFFLFSTISNLIAESPKELEDSLMRIAVTYQEGSAYMPWRWKSPTQRSGQGLVVGENLVLVLSSLVLNSTHIEGRLRAEPSATILKVLHMDLDRGIALLQGKLPSAAKVFELPQTSFFQQGAKVNTFWKTDEGRFMEGHGTIDRAESAAGSDSNQILYWYEGSNVSIRGGYGEPVFCAGNFIGLGANNGRGVELSILPVEMIRARYDLPSGRLNPDTAMPGFYTSPCKQKHLRRSKGLAEDDGGCIVVDVMEQGSGSQVLKKGDILLSFDGHPLDAWGRYFDPSLGWLSWQVLLCQMTLDAKPKCTIVRDAQRMEVELTLSTIAEDHWLIPNYREGETPRYFIRGGFVFQNLSLSYVRAWGKDWEKNAPDEILMTLDEEHGKIQSPEKKETVILSQVLSHPINRGLQYFGRQVIEAVNDVPLTSLDQLKSILDDPSTTRLKLSLRTGNTPLLLDAAELRKADRDIAKWYSIAVMSSID
jgi:hypothetical protein